ncbi:hypothetical protein K432DRAFT_472063, partial [Lepidopterella palustris CBS 459.81]
MVRLVTEDDTGLRVLYEPSAPETSDTRAQKIDIVAVHGIGAHPDDTWSKNVGSPEEPQYVNWLQDPGMLPSTVPNARILRYGYESQWFGDDTVDRVRLKASTIAVQLLLELHVEREEFPYRPLIFVAHCFGGLVVLKALRQAFDNTRKWPGIFASTAGLVFFGTPFRGTEGMKQSEMIEAALSRYRPDQIQGESLRILVPGDEFLQDSVDRFLETRSEPHPAPVACFYETKSSNVGAIVGSSVKREFVVNETSGCLDHSDSIEKYPLARTHFDMNKFGRVSEPSYKIVRKIMTDMAVAAPGLVLARSQYYRNHKGSRFGHTHVSSSLRLEDNHVSSTVGIPKAHFYVPFGRNKLFVGRGPQLEEMDTKFFAEDSYRKVAVFGLGGVGKTQVVLEFAYRTREKRPDCSIFWIPASSVEKVKQAYLDIGQLLQIPGLTDEKIDAMQLVKQKLSQESVGRWLLILDSADDADMWFQKVGNGPQTTALIDYLPRSSKGSVVFTTRDRKAALKMASAKDVMEIREMDKNVATNLLENSLMDPTAADNQETRLKLLDRLTYLPLAIVQAAAYMNANGIMVSDYLSLFEDTEENVIEVLSKDFEDEGRYRDLKNPVATTWLISFEQIRHRDPLAAEYLSYMSCLDANRIPKSLLPAAQPRERVFSAIGTLAGYSFITKRTADSYTKDTVTGDQLFDLHRLVHLATRNWLREKKTLEEWTKKAITRLAEVFPTHDHENQVFWTAYLPHAHYVLESPLLGADNIERLTLLKKVALCLLADGKYFEAEAPFVEVIETISRVLGAEHPFTLANMANLASTYRNQGRWKEAEELEVQVMETSKRVLGEEHPNTLTSMSNLASTFWNQGRWKEAEELQAKELKICSRVLGEEH